MISTFGLVPRASQSATWIPQGGLERRRRWFHHVIMKISPLVYRQYSAIVGSDIGCPEADGIVKQVS